MKRQQEIPLGDERMPENRTTKGTPLVVESLWILEDRSLLLNQLSTRLYRRMAQGRAPEDAILAIPLGPIDPFSTSIILKVILLILRYVNNHF